MNPPPSTTAARVSLDELIAINREIAALVRAGIPLELGLRSFAGGLQNRVGRLAQRIADGLSGGIGLAEVIEKETSGEFSVYGAVITAGLQSGQLPEALEEVATSAELIETTRRQLALSLIYPIVVCVMGYLFLLGFVGIVVPRYLGTARDFGFENDLVFELMRQVYSTTYIWSWLVPVIVTVLVLLSRTGWSGGRWFFDGISMMQLVRRAQFADLLQMQIAKGLPLAPSFRRAADGCGDKQLCAAATSICGDTDRGVPFATAVSESVGLPPLMQWMLATGARQGTLAQSLILVRDSCRRRALRQSQLLKVWVPAVFTLFFAGSVVLIYALASFIPLMAFWEGIGRE